MTFNSSNTLIEIDNKILDSNLAKNLKKKFNSKLINRILLIQPPDSDQSGFKHNAGKRGRLYNYPPYGIGLIAPQLRKINKKFEQISVP